MSRSKMASVALRRMGTPIVARTHKDRRVHTMVGKIVLEIVARMTAVILWNRMGKRNFGIGASALKVRSKDVDSNSAHNQSNNIEHQLLLPVKRLPEVASYW